MKLYECQNCGELWREDQIRTAIPAEHAGVVIDETPTSARCPECGAFCHRDSQNRRFDVHIFALIRIVVRNLKASDHEAAIAKAVDRANLEPRFRQSRDTCEYAGEISHYVVDVCGDADFAEAVLFDAVLVAHG